MAIELQQGIVQGLATEVRREGKGRVSTAMFTLNGEAAEVDGRVTGSLRDPEPPPIHDGDLIVASGKRNRKGAFEIYAYSVGNSDVIAPKSPELYIALGIFVIVASIPLYIAYPLIESDENVRLLLIFSMLLVTSASVMYIYCGLTYLSARRAVASGSA